MRHRVAVVLALVIGVGVASFVLARPYFTHGANGTRDGAEMLRCGSDCDRVVLLTQAHGANHEAALGGGVLRLDVELMCVYLEQRDGTRLLPQWPEGYYALSRPVHVNDANNKLIAEEGELVTFSGGYHDPAELPKSSDRCGVSRVDGLFVMGSPQS